MGYIYLVSLRYYETMNKDMLYSVLNFIKKENTFNGQFINSDVFFLYTLILNKYVELLLLLTTILFT